MSNILVNRIFDIFFYLGAKVVRHQVSGVNTENTK